MNKNYQDSFDFKYLKDQLDLYNHLPKKEKIKFLKRGFDGIINASLKIYQQDVQNFISLMENEKKLLFKKKAEKESEPKKMDVPPAPENPESQ